MEDHVPYELARVAARVVVDALPNPRLLARVTADRFGSQLHPALTGIPDRIGEAQYLVRRPVYGRRTEAQVERLEGFQVRVEGRCRNRFRSSREQRHRAA